MPPIYIALIHYPTVNKHGELVTTSITNFDLHDLARTSRTFGVEKCFIVTPNEAQKKMALFIKKYWREGFGAGYNTDRRDAFEVLEVARDIEETCLTIKNIHDSCPKLIATSAKKNKKLIDFKSLRSLLLSEKEPLLILFGTGWGLAPEVLNQCDYVLEPITGPTEYNHLPVRSAVAIVLDRLLGVKTVAH